MFPSGKAPGHPIGDRYNESEAPTGEIDMAFKGPATAKLFIFFTLLGVLPCGAGNVGS